MEKIGICWYNQSRKTGEKYLSGFITINNKDYRIAIFKNKLKYGNNAPDFRILLLEENEKPSDIQFPDNIDTKQQPNTPEDDILPF